MNEDHGTRSSRGTHGVIRFIVVPALVLLLILRPALLTDQPDDLTLALGFGGLGLMLLALDRRAGGVASFIGCCFAVLHRLVLGDAQMAHLTWLVMLYAPALGVSLALFPRVLTPGDD